MKNSKPLIELSVIIVNWNGGELLRRCIESLLCHSPKIAHQIIVVDNASSDGSQQFLYSNTNNIRLIENTDNVGFAKANNQAIQLCESRLIFLLNPDTEVAAGSIDALVKTVTSEDQIGACGPKLLNANGSLQPNAWRLPPTPLYILFEGLGLYLLLPKTIRANWLLGRHWDHSYLKSVPAFSGAAMMVKRKVVEDIGAFDERFWMFGEDGEWCVRMKRHGWQLYIEPTAEVIHYGGQSAMKRWTDEERRLKEVEGQILFQRQVLSRVNFMLNRLAQAFVLVVIGLWRLVRLKSASLLTAAIRMHLSYFKNEISAFSGSKASARNYKRERELG